MKGGMEPAMPGTAPGGRLAGRFVPKEYGGGGENEFRGSSQLPWGLERFLNWGGTRSDLNL